MRGPELFSQGGAMNQNQSAPSSVEEVYQRGMARARRKLEEIRQRQAAQMRTSTGAPIQQSLIEEEVVVPVVPVEQYHPPVPAQIPVGPGVIDSDDELIRDGSGAWIRKSLFGV